MKNANNITNKNTSNKILCKISYFENHQTNIKNLQQEKQAYCSIWKSYEGNKNKKVMLSQATTAQ